MDTILFDAPCPQDAMPTTKALPHDDEARSVNNEEQTT
jgi:hypothetical protein